MEVEVGMGGTVTGGNGEGVGGNIPMSRKRCETRGTRRESVRARRSRFLGCAFGMTNG